MLVQFVVENFLSFKDKQILSMRAPEAGAARIGAAFQEGRRQTVRADGEEILRCAALYGANASGKSNLVRALDFVRHLVLEGTDSNSPIARRPFKLDPACRDRPSRFELAFIHDDVLYSYGFTLDGERIHAEWLYRGPENAEALLFRRELDASSGKYGFEVGDDLASDPMRRQFYGFLHEGTRPNQLFLREAQGRNTPELDAPVTWFRKRLVVIHPDQGFGDLTALVADERAFADFLGALLDRIGTGISHVGVRKTLHRASRRDIAALFEGRSFVLLSEDNLFRLTEQQEVEEITLNFFHRVDVTTTAFAPEEESDGTRRFMHLARMLYRDEGSRTAVFVIDEIDRSLHPLLTRFFLEEFLRAGEAAQTSQLICTTHDTNLLDVNLLPPSSIWFVEKARTGSSHLYSLDEFDEAQLAALRDQTEEGYLAGRFGAIPFIGNRRRLITDPGPEGKPGGKDEG
jgi:AAA15 family ATPase/GTPase